MTIAKIIGFNRNIAVGRSDRGGNSMNLISKALMKLDFNSKRGNYKAEINRNLDVYGYALYQSLEYGVKHLKNDGFGFGEYPLNRMMR